MKFTTPLSVVPIVMGTAMASQAPKVSTNPDKAIAIADFPQGGNSQKTLGNVIFYTKKNNEVKVHVDMTGLPAMNGPFQYHIHEYPIGANGDCESTGLHFNPYGATPDCSLQPDDSYCQVGDLSGKHGWINTTCFETKYYDPYLSLDPNSPAYVIGRSVVFHYANLTKFACADIVPLSKQKLTSLDNAAMEKANEYMAGQLEGVTIGDDKSPQVQLERRNLDTFVDDDMTSSKKWNPKNSTIPKHNYSNNSNASLNHYESSIYDDSGSKSGNNAGIIPYMISGILFALF
ncbi:uncharacterized protein KQ657_004729 [Scheffersomyces spartinae]|uniref:superoxide dismutase n=1 Tax=Scheffersomyces spartinae TaxID=45513 RepID=A0A9P7VBY6_9ASCO|nr:uncharacterized protein KQ657_004729 [Scheffersomyces spartinae]KAG7194514.1 hypothetical protein KQ657_004729 [Scheffersomyces spartinae]